MNQSEALNNIIEQARKWQQQLDGCLETPCPICEKVRQELITFEQNVDIVRQGMRALSPDKKHTSKKY